MKLFNPATFLLTVAICALPSLTVAGEYAYGIWSTNDSKAMKSAFTLAESKVKSSGKGCVGRGKNDKTTSELIIEENGNKVRYGVYISHHNGSCRIKQNIIGAMSETTGIDVDKIITAWAGG